jgi:hypothetical protein
LESSGICVPPGPQFPNCREIGDARDDCYDLFGSGSHDVRMRPLETLNHRTKDRIGLRYRFHEEPREASIEHAPSADVERAGTVQDGIECRFECCWIRLPGCPQKLFQSSDRTLKVT